MDKFGIKEPDHQRLEEMGFKEYKGRLLPAWANPFTNSYMYINYFLIAACLGCRAYQVKTNLTGKFINSCAIIGLVYSTMSQRKKFDYPLINMNNDLEENLLLSPVTRRAYQQAISENEKFQSIIKQKILELENSNKI